MTESESVRPFACGTQYADWTASNCSTCKKAAAEGVAFHEMPCEIEAALVLAYLGTGRVPPPVAERMGLTANPDRHCWPCREHDPPFANVRPDGTVDPNVARSEAP